mmetsp:Transcript_18917/g.41205  ORF Transcript_18917/g.41205 Transcript_18917/m.41205 type:complete len:129 (-) Transcript_18917:33-419(-)
MMSSRWTWILFSFSSDLIIFSILSHSSMVPLGTLKNNNGVYVFFFPRKAGVMDLPRGAASADDGDRRIKAAINAFQTTYIKEERIMVVRYYLLVSQRLAVGFCCVAQSVTILLKARRQEEGVGRRLRS